MNKGIGISKTREANDIRLLFATRILRMFAYGFLSVVLVLYLVAIGFSERNIGLLITLTLVGDTVLSLWLTTQADQLGRRRTLMFGALLMVFAGGVFAISQSFWVLLLAATLGVISPSGNEVGPFLAVEQAALSEEVAPLERTRMFAWYNLVGSFATALGALSGGMLAEALQAYGKSPLTSYRWVVVVYGLVGIGMAVLFQRLSSKVEPLNSLEIEKRPVWLKANLGLGPSRRNVLKLAGLFTVDAFAGGFVVQAFVAYWFQARYGVSPGTLGAIFFGANLLAGVSALTATWLAKRIGLLATMVATHIPSNVLLCLVPLMPNLTAAILVLLLRFSISQMDVPTRQAYTMALVTSGERSAAAGVTGIARTIGASCSPLLAGPLFASAAFASLPFFLAGGLKTLYDLAIWRTFRKIKLPTSKPWLPTK